MSLFPLSWNALLGERKRAHTLYQALEAQKVHESQAPKVIESSKPLPGREDSSGEQPAGCMGELHGNSFPESPPCWVEMLNKEADTGVSL